MNGEIFGCPDPRDRDDSRDSINPLTQFEIERLLTLLEERSESGNVLGLATEVELVDKKSPRTYIRAIVFNDSLRSDNSVIASVIIDEIQGDVQHPICMYHLETISGSLRITKDLPSVGSGTINFERIINRTPPSIIEAGYLENVELSMSFVSKLDIRGLTDLIREAEVYKP